MSSEPIWLGMDGGGTRLVAMAVDSQLDVLSRMEVGPANLQLLSDADLVDRFHTIRASIPESPTALGIGLAGLVTPADGFRVSQALERVWPDVPAAITHDLETAWWAAEPFGAKATGQFKSAVRVIIVSGTGSCCYGRSREGQTAKVGGWGHRLGDRGSAYSLVETGLRVTLSRLDRQGQLGELGGRVLSKLLMNDPTDLIAWVQSASKAEIAALAPEVFSAATTNDPAAQYAVELALNDLVEDAIAAAGRMNARGRVVDFVGAGSVLLAQPEFASKIRLALRKALPGSRFRCLEREPVWGAIELARKLGNSGKAPLQMIRPSRPSLTVDVKLPTPTAIPLTEEVDPRFSSLDRLGIAGGLELMLSEEGTVAAAVASQSKVIVRLVRSIVRSLRAGGRLFYVGAGTSGRLGVLDASECPPTFRTPPHMVQGIIAGGTDALIRSIEGSEDDMSAGKGAIEFRRVSSKDVVVGIAASGRTPFVWAALTEARARGATTALISCNPRLEFSRQGRPPFVIEIPTGPEVLAGSTRLKAGTATKIVLNALTTLTMIQLGKVAGNLMVDLDPSNQKLRHRAVGIVSRLTMASESDAENALKATGWVVKDAALRLGWRSSRGIGRP